MSFLHLFAYEDTMDLPSLARYTMAERPCLCDPLIDMDLQNILHGMPATSLCIIKASICIHGHIMSYSTVLKRLQGHPLLLLSLEASIESQAQARYRASSEGRG